MTDSIPAASTRLVTDAEIDTYRQDGVVCLRNAFDAHWIAEMRSAFDLAKCVWLPLDPVPKAAAVEFIRGSQRSKVLYSPVEFSEGNALYDASMPAVPDIEGTTILSVGMSNREIAWCFKR